MVVHIVRRKKKPNGIWEEHHWERLKDLHSKGFDNNSIGIRISFSAETVKNKLLEIGLKPHPTGRGPGVTEQNRPLPPERPDPLAVAQKYLPGFDRLKMTYKGRPINLVAVMRRTNYLLVTWGLPQIDYDDLWVLKAKDLPALPPSDSPV